MLAFRFVATLGERRADPVERIGTPERLRAWLIANELGSADMPASESLLRDARALREAIHRPGTAMAAGGVPDPVDEDLLNRWTARHRARLILTGGQAKWHLPETDSTRAARRRRLGRRRDPRRPR
ncbi:ABATE domain-containing protein [Streptomyces libani]|uniref:ABATE domain-containing protein n=1 Tax=Streptomyces nigrescens TaxID=1920 RepID=UPI0037FA6FF0